MDRKTPYNTKQNPCLFILHFGISLDIRTFNFTDDRHGSCLENVTTHCWDKNSTDKEQMRHILKKILLVLFLTFFFTNYGQKDSLTIPVVQAQFPGGQKALNKYLKTNVSDKVTLSDDGTPSEKVIAKFYIDADGKATDARIVKTSGHQNIDSQFIEAINAMPKWTPAENSKGKKVRQEITIPIYLCTR